LFIPSYKEEKLATDIVQTFEYDRSYGVLILCELYLFMVKTDDIYDCIE